MIHSAPLLSPERLVDIVKERCSASNDKFCVFWFTLDSNREDYARKVRDIAGKYPIVPIVLRREGFENPNSVLADLNSVLVVERFRIEQALLNSDANLGPIAVILLSYSKLNVPQISSPTVMPEWFGKLGGQIIHVLIENLQYSSLGSMKAPEAKLGDMCYHLYNLERAMLKRLQSVHKSHHTAGAHLFELIKEKSKEKNKESDEKYTEFLDQAAVAILDVTSAEGFRPSARSGKFVVARLLRLSAKTSPDGMTACAKSLASALAIEDDAAKRVGQSLISVLARPTEPDSGSVRFCRTLITTLYATAQFVTAEAHAGDYPNFPIQLLSSVSLDLRQTLADLVIELERRI